MNESINQFRILGIVCKPRGACVDREYVTVWKICNPILFRVIQGSLYVQMLTYKITSTVCHPAPSCQRKKKIETVKLQFEKRWKFCK